MVLSVEKRAPAGARPPSPFQFKYVQTPVRPMASARPRRDIFISVTAGAAERGATAVLQVASCA